MKTPTKAQVRKELKKEFLDKLDELGIFDEWYMEWKKQYNDGSTIIILNKNDMFGSLGGFISMSFTWGDTKHGHDYWYCIADEK